MEPPTYEHFVVYSTYIWGKDVLTSSTINKTHESRVFNL